MKMCCLRDGLDEDEDGCRNGEQDMCDDFGIKGVIQGVQFQLRHATRVTDVSLYRAARWAGSDVIVWIKESVQLRQPIALAFETAKLRSERAALLNYGQELIQKWVSPFFWLRPSEASIRVKSSKTRRPPSTNGGLLPSVSVERINSA